jgi:hypothetical protein
LPFAQFGASIQDGSDDQLRLVAEVVPDQRWIDASRQGDIKPGNLTGRHHLHQLPGRRNQGRASDRRHILLRPALLSFCVLLW